MLLAGILDALVVVLAGLGVFGRQNCPQMGAKTMIAGAVALLAAFVFSLAIRLLEIRPVWLKKAAGRAGFGLESL